MIKIKDKKDSVVIMKTLGLNYFPLEVFDHNDKDGILKFVEKFPAKEYAVRDSSKAKGEFFFAKDYEEILKGISKYAGDVTICVSYNPYKENLVLVGDIKVHRGENEDDDIIDLTARDDVEATHRNIYENPQYNFHTTIDDDRLWKVNGFAKIMRYVTDNNLYDVIVEFAVYNVPLGIKNNEVVVSEIRTSY